MCLCQHVFSRFYPSLLHNPILLLIKTSKMMQSRWGAERECEDQVLKCRMEENECMRCVGPLWASQSHSFDVGLFREIIFPLVVGKKQHFCANSLFLCVTDQEMHTALVICFLSVFHPDFFCDILYDIYYGPTGLFSFATEAKVRKLPGQVEMYALEAQLAGLPN